MIALKCCGCGRTGRVSERHAGRRVHCRHCRAANVVPTTDTLEVFVADWLAAIGGRYDDAAAVTPAMDAAGLAAAS